MTLRRILIILAIMVSVVLLTLFSVWLFGYLSENIVEAVPG
ncbi:MAG: hypothetical protein Q4P15_01525 [Propionibacteriaceae bacterium]|nr:hypothetical protein [Propionibacteriaceae bacterium]